MRVTKGFFAILALAFLPLPLMVGCDHSVAGSELHGRWVATGGLSLEFANGRFTRVRLGEVCTGTFVTDGGNVTFNIRGRSSETKPFEIDFPRLVIGGVTYFHDSPRLPDPIEGFWESFIGEGSTTFWMPMQFHQATRQRGSHWIWEGDYAGFTNRGIYTISARNIPNTGEMTMRITHVRGSTMASFIRYTLPVHMLRFFDWETLENPWHGDWWFDLDEAKMLFVDAANRADTLAAEQRIMNAKVSFFGNAGEVDFFDFTLEEDVEIQDLWGDLWGDEPLISDLLTIRNRATGAVITLFRQTGDDYTDDGPDFAPLSTSEENQECR